MQNCLIFCSIKLQERIQLRRPSVLKLTFTIIHYLWIFTEEWSCWTHPENSGAFYITLCSVTILILFISTFYCNVKLRNISLLSMCGRCLFVLMCDKSICFFFGSSKYEFGHCFKKKLSFPFIKTTSKHFDVASAMLPKRKIKEWM